jgi:hypothetical protein
MVRDIIGETESKIRHIYTNPDLTDKVKRKKVLTLLEGLIKDKLVVSERHINRLKVDVEKFRTIKRLLND